MAVQIGLTLAQVCDHSLPQIELLAAAVNRDRSTQTLLNMQTNHAAIAACVSRTGHEHFVKAQAALQAGAEGAERANGGPAAATEMRRNRRVMAAMIQS